MSCVQSQHYNILMVAPTSFFADYGCHVRILEEAQILRKLGHRVTVVTYHNGNDVPGLDIRRTLPIPRRHDYEVGSSRHKIAFDALLGLKTLQLLASEKFDVIHAHLHEGALIGIILGRLFHLPVVFDFQGSMTEEMIDHQFLRRDSAAYTALRRLEHWIDQATPVVLTSSAHSERMLREQFACDPKHVRALPDCVNPDVFRPADTYDAQELIHLRSALGIPKGRKLIVYLGLLAQYQGSGLLLESLSRIVNERRDVHLLMMGFPGLDVYKQKARDLGISDFVTFTGRVPYQQAPTYLALGDVGVAPKLSLTEGAGKILNYMSVGLPVVAFNTPVAREYLGHDGLLATPGSVDELACNLRACLFPPELMSNNYRLMGQRLRQRAIQHFSWIAAGHQIVEAYREVLERTPTRVASKPGWATHQKRTPRSVTKLR